MTRAVISDELGAIEGYTLRAYDPGPPGPGQLRIAIRAAGVSFVDVLNATGQYQLRPPVPFIPGSEFAGVVEALGDEVTEFEVGQFVAATCWGGAFAEAAVVPTSAAAPLPQGMGFAEAAVFKVSALTAFHALVDRGGLQTGETLLVLGAGGATGYAAVQLGKYLGARVIASASSEAKRNLALNAGAVMAIDAGSKRWRDEVREACGGQPIDVVFDPVGGAATEQAFRCLGWHGRHLVVGFPAGIASLPSNLPLLRGASLVGVNLQQLAGCDPTAAAIAAERISKLASQGLLHPHVAATFPLTDFTEAMQCAARGQTAGRVVIQMGDGQP